MADHWLNRWVGIDEAGYGPNLGPLVMTAVQAEGPNGPSPDIWSDLAPLVDRAGGDPARLWIDDSKRITQSRVGLGRLSDATLSLLRTVSPLPYVPIDGLSRLLEALVAGSLADGEWDRWVEPDQSVERLFPPQPATARLESNQAPWRFIAVRSAVVGPEAFNHGLARTGNKAQVHFETFGRLLRSVWDQARDRSVIVTADKHGGRHFYHAPLQSLFPDHWIERGVEGPALSRYVIRGADRQLEIRLAPRSDADNGLVALASMVSKLLRERWMAVFNAFWQRRVPGLRPTAGYPVDARRFRDEVGATAERLGLPPSLWWRDR